MESSGVDEGRGLDAGRIHAAALLRPVRTVLLEISAKLCGGRGGDPGGDGAERSRHRPRRPHARLSMAAGIRNRIREEPPRSRAAEERDGNADLDSGSQLQPVGPGSR